MPISIGLAPTWSKKLVSNTPPVILIKIAANTPSMVEALRLVRIDGLLPFWFWLSGKITDDVPGFSV